MGDLDLNQGPYLYNTNLGVSEDRQGQERTYGTGINKTLKHPSKVFPQLIPRLLNKGLAARGIPAPIMDRKKSLDARTEAAYCG